MMDHERDEDLHPELREAIARLPRSVEPPEDLWPGIRDQIRAGGLRRGRPAGLVRWMPLALAAVLVLAVAWWLGGGGGAHGTSEIWEVER
ncbi:MAG: hypothetical protein ACREMW_05390, partial [Gemmatimonadales bacterium]